MANQKVTVRAAGQAVSRALARRGGSAFRITSRQREAIVRDATSGRAARSGDGKLR